MGLVHNSKGFAHPNLVTIRRKSSRGYLDLGTTTQTFIARKTSRESLHPPAARFPPQAPDAPGQHYVEYVRSDDEDDFDSDGSYDRPYGVPVASRRERRGIKHRTSSREPYTLGPSRDDDGYDSGRSAHRHTRVRDRRDPRAVSGTRQPGAVISRLESWEIKQVPSAAIKPSQSSSSLSLSVTRHKSRDVKEKQEDEKYDPDLAYPSNDRSVFSNMGDLISRAGDFLTNRQGENGRHKNETFDRMTKRKERTRQRKATETFDQLVVRKSSLKVESESRSRSRSRTPMTGDWVEQENRSRRSSSLSSRNPAGRQRLNRKVSFSDQDTHCTFSDGNQQEHDEVEDTSLNVPPQTLALSSRISKPTTVSSRSSRYVEPNSALRSIRYEDELKTHKRSRRRHRDPRKGDIPNAHPTRTFSVLRPMPMKGWLSCASCHGDTRHLTWDERRAAHGYGEIGEVVALTPSRPMCETCFE